MYISSHRSNATTTTTTVLLLFTNLSLLTLGVTAAAAAAAAAVAAFQYQNSSENEETVTTLSTLSTATVTRLQEFWIRGKTQLWNQFHNVIIRLVGVGEDDESNRKRPMKVQDNNNDNSSNEDISTNMTVVPIGVVRSIYRLCVGTPRQGLLAPNARGRIELMTSSTDDNNNNSTTMNASTCSDMVDGLEGFSHVWIVFWFHLNTTSKHKTTTTANSNVNTRKKRTQGGAPTKIAPPALGGKKVGVLATRSPHRRNPIGITLCKLDSIMTVSVDSVGGATNVQGRQHHKSGRGSGGQMVILNISGLDLVDGTPVLDIKPYVPNYDSIADMESLRLPPWVSGGLETKRPVRISHVAQQELRAILTRDPFSLDFYGPHRGDGCIMETAARVQECIEQVLAMDVRSAYQTSKARSGKSQAERAERVRTVMATTTTLPSGIDNQEATETDKHWCSQQLDNLLIHYSVDAPEETSRETSQGSGAEDFVTVHSLQLILKPRATNREEQRASRQAHVSSPTYRSPAAQSPSATLSSANKQNAHPQTPDSKRRSRPSLPQHSDMDWDASASFLTPSVLLSSSSSSSSPLATVQPDSRESSDDSDCLLVVESGTATSKDSPQSHSDSMPDFDADDLVIIH